jgi:hypothetical protein
MAQLILEARRLQELAGIQINEDETDAALSQGLSALKGLEGFGELEEEEEISEVQGELNEALITLIGSGLLVAPKFLQGIAIVVNKITKAFTGKEENKIADKIDHFAHKWEGLYIKAIKSGIKFFGIAKDEWYVNGKVDQAKLNTTAKIVYVIILALAMGNAVGTVLGPASPIIKALEATFGGIKGFEIAQIVSSIKGKI